MSNRRAPSRRHVTCIGKSMTKQIRKEYSSGADLIGFMNLSADDQGRVNTACGWSVASVDVPDSTYAHSLSEIDSLQLTWHAIARPPIMGRAGTSFRTIRSSKVELQRARTAKVPKSLLVSVILSEIIHTCATNEPILVFCLSSEFPE